jgi:hypothetical protein
MIRDRDEVHHDQVREFFEAHRSTKSPIDVQPSKSASSQRMRFLNTVRPPSPNARYTHHFGPFKSMAMSSVSKSPLISHGDAWTLFHRNRSLNMSLITKKSGFRSPDFQASSDSSHVSRMGISPLGPTVPYLPRTRKTEFLKV